jgi:hypothetical protein
MFCTGGVPVPSVGIVGAEPVRNKIVAGMGKLDPGMGMEINLRGGRDGMMEGSHIR